MSQNSRNQGFSYYICLMIEGSRSRAGSGSGSIPLTNGSGWPKNTWIRWIRIRIRNTAFQCCGTVTIFYGSSSHFWQVTVPVPYLSIKAQFSKNNLEKILPFYILNFFTREKSHKFHQIYCKMWMKNQKQNFILSFRGNFCDTYHFTTIREP